MASSLVNAVTLRVIISWSKTQDRRLEGGFVIRRTDNWMLGFYGSCYTLRTVSKSFVGGDGKGNTLRQSKKDGRRQRDGAETQV